MTHHSKRDFWGSKWGFILACIGSAVGMGNIWLFPARVSAYGGATFLIPYLIFVVIIGSTGVIGEMAFGRATRSGPIGAFGAATQRRFSSDKPGKLLGLIPVLGSLALAIGYSVVTGWIFKYTAQAITGTLSSLEGVDAFNAHFNNTALGNVPWQLVGMVVTIAIMAFGVGRGIEKANKVMTPLFFVLFIGLAIYLVTLPGSAAGYRYIFVLEPEGLLDPMVWVYALGQAFFSLSVAGNGTLVYGSYLSKDSDIPADARMVALFDTLAAILAALVTLLSVAVHSVPLCVAGLCITGISYGACPTISSAFTSSFYGAKYFSLNFSVMNFNLTGASFVATAASVLLTQTGGYAAPLVLLLVLAVAALALNFSIKRP